VDEAKPQPVGGEHQNAKDHHASQRAVSRTRTLFSLNLKPFCCSVVHFSGNPLFMSTVLSPATIGVPFTLPNYDVIIPQTCLNPVSAFENATLKTLI